MKFNLSCSHYTHPGSRPVNEDSVSIAHTDCGSCFILCDGLGGHGMGDVASSVVCESFKEDFASAKDMSGFIEPAFLKAQDVLLQKQTELRAKMKMKTTATVLVTDDKKAYIGHIGDSRLYIFRKNKVFFRTLDHSVPQMLVMSGEIKESEIRNHPERYMLLRVMGVEWNSPLYELQKPVPLRKCNAFLLCSDGFWELITEDEMCALLKESKDVTEWLDKMKAIVIERGEFTNSDNNTAIAVWVD